MGVDNVDVRISDIVNGVNVISGSDAGSPDPYDYRGKCIELFTEHYINITSRSSDGAYWAPAGRPADYYMGWVPDALIPFAAPQGLGGAPFGIPANQNQGVWVDIYIPRHAAPGTYTGTIDITVNGSTSNTIPINLDVYDFTLSDETHTPSFSSAYGNEMMARHGFTVPWEQYYNKVKRYYQMAHRHRFDFAYTASSVAGLEIYKEYISGEAYTPAYGYEGPGEGLGLRIFHQYNMPTEWGGWPPGSWTEETWRQGTDMWINWFTANAPATAMYKLLYPDEPSPADYPLIVQQGDWDRGNPGPGRNVVTMTTRHIVPEIKGHVDAWCEAMQATRPGRTNVAEVRAEQAAGVKFGVYNGYRAASGTVVIDTDATDFRTEGVPVVWTGIMAS